MMIKLLVEKFCHYRLKGFSETLVLILILVEMPTEERRLAEEQR